MAKATKAVAGDPVVFCGIPSSLTGVLLDATEPGTDIALTVRGIRGAKEALEFAVQADQDPRVLHLFLPAYVLPGSYQGELSVDGTTWPAQVDVEPEPNVRVFPEQMRISTRAGETVSRTLRILNAGNVPITLRKVQAFGVMLTGGIERALRRAYVTPLAVAERRIDVLAESLAEAHGGLVRMSVTNGAGVLQQGELRAIDVSVRIPPNLAAGTEYTGNWELAGMVYPVTIQIAGTAAEGDDAYEGDDVGDENNTPGIR
jgi:hypothetical protein